MPANGNPLITDNNSDTIERTRDFIELMCQASEGDNQAHPGMFWALIMVRDAVASLRPETPDLQNDA